MGNNNDNDKLVKRAKHKDKEVTRLLIRLRASSNGTDKLLAGMKKLVNEVESGLASRDEHEERSREENDPEYVDLNPLRVAVYTPVGFKPGGQPNQSYVTGSPFTCAVAIEEDYVYSLRGRDRHGKPRDTDPRNLSSLYVLDDVGTDAMGLFQLDAYPVWDSANGSTWQVSLTFKTNANLSPYLQQELLTTTFTMYFYNVYSGVDNYSLTASFMVTRA